MPQLIEQYNAANPLNVLVGSATLWVAAYTGVPVALPPESSTALGAAWPTPWITPGATESGVTWGVDEKDTDITIDEQPNPAMVVADTQDYNLSTTLMEDTLSNMQLAYGRGTIASTAGTGGRSDPTCGTTSGSVTVTDTAITSGDVGKNVAGAGIPLGTIILSVVVSTSFVMSNPATATGSVTLAIGGTGGNQTLTMSITKSIYTVGMEGTNLYGKPRRIYLPVAVVTGEKVDTDYRRAKAAHMYKTSFRAICPPSQIEVVEYNS